MDISWCNVDIGNEIEFEIYCPVVEIKESFRLAVPNHIAAFGVSGAYFNFLSFLHFLSLF